MLRVIGNEREVRSRREQITEAGQHQ
jgi:hypothetical protein